MRTLSHLFPFIGDPEHVENYLWRSWDDATAELEVLEFWHALIRMTKPALVWEAGGGRSTIVLADALAQNRAGRLVTFETSEKWWMRTREMVSAYRNAGGAIGEVAVINGRLPSPGMDDERPDLLFIDSQQELRQGDIEGWADESGPVVVVHDSEHWRSTLDIVACEGTHLPSSRGVWVGVAR